MAAAALNSGQGAVKVSGTSQTAYERLSKAARLAIDTSLTSYDAITPNADKDVNKEIFGTTNPPAANIIVPTSAPTTGMNGVTIPVGYKFNLPPHSWSLPIRPSMLGFQEESFTRTTSFNNFHGLRRGRIWFYLGEYDLKRTNNGTVQGTDSYLSNRTTAPGPSEVNAYTTAQNKKQGKSLQGARNYGFQFLWNPETINSSVSINMDIVPNAADRFRSVSGIFLGNTTVSLNLMLDRTNDFACFKGDPTTNSGGAVGDTRNFFSPGSDYWSKYYKATYPKEDKSKAMSVRVYELMELGTLADLEYLFKTLNGDGLSEKENWTNLLGRKTADIGYIQPILVALQLGPSLESLSYVGWVDSVSITHLAFTETMIPIRTSVALTFRAMTGTGIING